MPEKQNQNRSPFQPSPQAVQSGINGAVAGLLGFNLILLAGITILFLFNTIPTLAAEQPASEATALSLQNETLTPVPATITPSSTPAPSITPTRTDSPTPTHTLTATRTAAPTETQTATLVPFKPDPIQIGTSVQGHPLEVYTFGSGPTRRMIVAGIHGGYEANTTNLAYALINHLSRNYHTIPGEVTLYILPVLNPDGLARSLDYDGRANAHGVDLNRNWDADWQPQWPLEGCWRYTPVTGGDFAGSEPETRALADFIQSHYLDALISYHSAALGIFPGGKFVHPPSLDLAEDVAAVSDYPYPPLPTGCEYTGQLIDWAAHQDIAALDIELSTHESIDWETNLAILEVFLNWQAP